MEDLDDIDALLEAPFKNSELEEESKSKRREVDSSRPPYEENGRDRSFSGREGEKRHQSRREGENRNYQRRDGENRHRNRSRSPHHKRSRSSSAEKGLRDKKTVFVTQLAQRVRSPELLKFFRGVGRIRAARVVFDKISRRSKGVGYVEFSEEHSVPKAIGMTGQKLCGIPIMVQPSEAEKNRLAEEAAQELERQKKQSSSKRLYVASIHFGISMADLRKVFEPFGEIEEVTMVKDPVSGQFKGVAYVQYCDERDARKALETMNGFELAGRQIRVGMAFDKGGSNATGGSIGDSEATASTGNNLNDDSETMGISMNAKARVDLMKKLAAGKDLSIPETTTIQKDETISTPANQPPENQQKENLIIASQTSEVATPFIVLTNMYNPMDESDPNWKNEIEQEVKEECQKHGKVLHVHVPGSINGQVFLAFAGVSAAKAVQSEMDSRFFAGRQLTASFIPEQEYQRLFPHF